MSANSARDQHNLLVADSRTDRDGAMWRSDVTGASGTTQAAHSSTAAPQASFVRSENYNLSPKLRTQKSGSDRGSSACIIFRNGPKRRTALRPFVTRRLIVRDRLWAGVLWLCFRSFLSFVCGACSALYVCGSMDIVTSFYPERFMPSHIALS